MESLADYLSSDDQQDDEDQAKLNDTISSILNDSLGDKDTADDDSNSVSKSAAEESPGSCKENLDGETAVTEPLTDTKEDESDGQRTSTDVDDPTNQVVSADQGKENAKTELISSLIQGDSSGMEVNERNSSPANVELEEQVTEKKQDRNKDSSSETEEKLSTPDQEQGEPVVKVMDQTVTEDNPSNILDSKQPSPQKRRIDSVETVSDKNSPIKSPSSPEHGPSPGKRQKTAHDQPDTSISSDAKLADPPEKPKKRGRPSKQFDNVGQENLESNKKKNLRIPTKTVQYNEVDPSPGSMSLESEEIEECDKRKSLRAPTKTVQYNEVDSSPEKGEKISVTKDHGTKMAKKLSSKSLQSEENDECDKKKTLRVPSKEVKERVQFRRSRSEPIKEDDFFLPEGWCFYAKQRHQSHIGKETYRKLYDMYYLTPKTRKKVRSRQELVSFFNKEGLDYDPLLFFVRQQIEPLLEKGILKYHDKHTIILDSNPEVIAYLPPARPSKDPQNQTIKTEENAEKIPSVKQEIKQPKEISKKLSRKSLSRKSPFSTKTKVSAPKSEPLSPTAPAHAQDVTPIVTKENSGEKISVSAPPKRRPGRPPRKKDPEVTTQLPLAEEQNTATNNAVEEKPVEEKVRIRSKPPRKSPYFSSSLSTSEQSKSLAGLRRERKSCDAPPRSPYNLIQEDLFHDPWQMLIATIFLNATSGKIAIPLALEFLKRWPTPQLARQAKVDDILDLIEPLGFGRTRAAIILRFSHEYLTKDWKLPNELYGIGDYGNDSYKIFCMKNEWKNVRSDDPMLMMYLNWRRATEHLRKKFLKSTDSSTRTGLENSSVKKVLRPRTPTPSPIKRRSRVK